jgi:hypothetical protein
MSRKVALEASISIVMVLIGACIPFTLGRETLGNLETFTGVLPELA